MYYGPITLQCFQIGGVQAIFNNALVINIEYDFVAIKEVVDIGINYMVNQFINFVPTGFFDNKNHIKKPRRIIVIE